MSADEALVSIRHDVDIITARQRGRSLASQLNFSLGELALIATAISEVARNIIVYAQGGEIVLRLIENLNRRGIMVVARDEGPGIPDIEKAMQDGYSTGGGLGVGLPGARRLMDEFEIESQLGKGTTIVMKKWAR
jgi:serine/threonine-protein kinase RsbT